MIILIFVPSWHPSELAHGCRHCVTGLTLPPVDANTLFITAVSLPEALKKTVGTSAL